MEEKLAGAKALEEEARPGKSIYALPTRWHIQWLLHVGLDDLVAEFTPAADQPTGAPSEIDNLSLLDEHKLGIKHELVEDVDYTFVPEAFWRLVYSTYGANATIGRPVVEHEGQVITEKHPRRVDVWLALPSGDVAYAEPPALRMLVPGVMNLMDATMSILRKLNRNRPSHEVIRAETARLWVRPQDADDADDAHAALEPTPAPAGSDGPGREKAETETETPAETPAETQPTTRKKQEAWGLVLGEDDMTLQDFAQDQKAVEVMIETRTSSDADFPRNKAWRENLKPGDVLDARDRDNKWFESVVVTRGGKDADGKDAPESPPDAGDDRKIRVHFKGWGSNFDEYKDLDAQAHELVPRYTYTENWKAHLYEGMEVEAKEITDNKPMWYYATVARIEDEKNLIHLSVETIDAVRIVPIDSEMYTQAGTHRRGAGRRTLDRRMSSGGRMTYGMHSRRNVAGAPIIPGAVGLYNLGNTCYMNSVLQCLAHTRGIKRCFVDTDFTADINTENILGSGGKVAKAFGNFMVDFWSNRYRAIAPVELKRTMIQFASHVLTEYQQQDSSEFMMVLLDALHEDLNTIRLQKKPYFPRIEYSEAKGISDEALAQEELRRVLCRNSSAIHKMCMGQSITRNTCCHCGAVTRIFEAYTVMSLPLASPNSMVVHGLFVRSQEWVAHEDFVRRRRNEPPTSSGSSAASGGGGDVSGPSGPGPASVASSLGPGVPFAARLETPAKAKNLAQWVQLNFSLLTRPGDDGSALGRLQLCRVSERTGMVVKVYDMGETMSPNDKSLTTSLPTKPLGYASTFETENGDGDDWDGDREFLVVYEIDHSLPHIQQAVVSDARGGGSGDSHRRATHDGSQSSGMLGGLAKMFGGVSIFGSGASARQAASAPRGRPPPPKKESSLPQTPVLDPTKLCILNVSIQTKDAHDGPLPWSSLPRRFSIHLPDLGSSGSLLTGGGAGGSSHGSSGRNGRAARTTFTLVALKHTILKHVLRWPNTNLESAIEVDRAWKELMDECVLLLIERNSDRDITTAPNDMEVLPMSGRGSYKSPRPPPVLHIALRFNDPKALDHRMLGVPSEPSGPPRPLNGGEPSSNGAVASGGGGSGGGGGGGRSGGLVDLTDCLGRFMDAEELGEGNQWECDACKEHCRAYKRLELWSTPDVLCVNLKRFSTYQAFGYRTVRRRKLNTPVALPLSIDFGQFTTGPVSEDLSTVYDIYGVVNHYGDLTSGHYTATVKDFQTGKWFDYNDSKLREVHVTEDNISGLSRSAYMVFYIRRGQEAPFGGIQPCDDKLWDTLSKANKAVSKAAEEARS